MKLQTINFLVYILGLYVVFNQEVHIVCTVARVKTGSLDVLTKIISKLIS